jgi:ribose transport system substrate-binding protein
MWRWPLALTFLLTACGGGDPAPTITGANTSKPAVPVKRPQVAYVTNGTASFWVIAAAGAKAAAKEVGADVDIRMPGDPTEQKQTVENLLVRGIDGIAISPIDPDNQTGMIDEACAQTRVITHDSDAPKSKRLCYVGMDNYEAGRMCGSLVVEALPEGGEIVIFIGRIEQDNARKRRQGVIDEILGRPKNSAHYDPPGAPLKNAKFKILDTRTDQFDRSRAKANAEDAIALHPNLACMVGLFAYNPPACLEALRGAGKLGKIKVVAFDEADETLQGILDGPVFGTVVQQPYAYGYESVRVLAALARGDRSVLPESGFLDIPAQIVRRANARPFWDDLTQKLEAGK